MARSKHVKDMFCLKSRYKTGGDEGRNIVVLQAIDRCCSMSFAFLFHLFRRQSVLKARRSRRSLYEAFSVDSTSTEDELTSLLTHRRKGLLKWRDSGTGFEPDGQQVTSFHEAWTETKQVLEFTWPLVIAYLAGTGTRLIDVWFLGRLGAQGAKITYNKR